jgi:hypothetical protein
VNSCCLRLSVACLAGTLAAACVPIPLMPGDMDVSRTNIGATVPEFIVAGRTTRADVLLALGEPDGGGEEGDQFTYSRIASKGGMAFLVAGAAGNSMGAGTFETRKMSYARLVVRFDSAGVVIEAKVQTDACMELAVSASSATGPCADPAGRDLPPIGAPDAATLDELARGHTFASVMWLRGSRGFDFVQNPSGASAPIFLKGRLVVGETNLLFFPPEAKGKTGPYLRLPYARIAEAYIEKYGRSRSLVIRGTGGAYETFMFGGFSVDREATEEAARLIGAHLKPAAPHPTP